MIGEKISRLAVTAAFGFFGVLLFGAPSEAAASSSSLDILSPSNIVLDYDAQTLAVTTADDEVLVAFPTVKTDEDGELASVTVKTWDVYDSSYKTYASDEAEESGTGTVTVDLSCVTVTKESYVAVRTSGTTNAYLIHFSAMNSKLTGSYDLRESALTFLNKADDNAEYSGLFEYRTGNSGWMDFNLGLEDDETEVSLKMYEQEGATLYFREKAGYYDEWDGWQMSGTLKDSNIAEVEKSTVDVGGEASEYCLAEAACTFAGPEIKVKITAAAKGPTATFTYTKRTIKIAKGMEYRFSPSDNFKAVTTATTLTLPDEGAGVFEVRKSEVTTGKTYKAPSKITRYEYAATQSIDLIEDSSGLTGYKTATLSVTYDTAKKKVTFTSTDTENKYLVYVVSKSSSVVPTVASSKTVATIAKVTSGSSKTVTVAKSKFPEGSKIYIAYAGDQKSKQWATTAYLLGTVSY